MVSIREATIEDCAKCAEISRIEELQTADLSYISEEYIRSFIDEDKMFFVAENAGEVIGYILGEPLKGKVALLGLLTVNKSQRGKGIGKKLIEAFRKRCDEMSIEHIFFYAPAYNEDTVEFYKKQGFIQGKEHFVFAEERKIIIL